MTITTQSLLTALLAVLLSMWRSVSYADAGLHSYAVVIGSNQGGDGQGTLSYAERDAERMAALLRELGRTPRGNIELLTEPTTDTVEQALSRLRAKLRAHAEAGERAQVLFYYSGHARAHALSLGREELSLSALRASLLALPSTLTVVVLDACQSGAFSGVKGARPAADFSLSSVRDLNSSGIAVMASSTGSELSQESSELGSSYFTHHLLVSLRGAGDLDRNGRVSLDEAYRYAYQHTLVDTARTQVGSQHATLETELTGRGDVPLSYPVDADAQLALPANVEGRVLVQIRNGAVLAELVKALGGTLLLALPSGSYDVLVRGDRVAQGCSVALTKGAVHTLALAECQVIQLPREQPKADRSQLLGEQRLARESWFLEFGAGLNFQRKDAFVRTLEEFGYQTRPTGMPVIDLAVGYQLHPSFALLARFDQLEVAHPNRIYRGSFEHQVGYVATIGHQLDYKWTTKSAMLGARYRLPLASHWVVGVAEIDAGLVSAHSDTTYGVADSMGIVRSHVEGRNQQAFGARGLVGFDFGFSRHFGMYLMGGYTYAAALENELGQRRNSGGPTVLSGLRVNGVKGWW